MWGELVFVNQENYEFFSALASKTRLAIIELLGKKKMNIRELSDELGLSTTIIAKHVKQLEEANVLNSESIPGKHGLQKRCSLAHVGVALNFKKERVYDHVHVFDIPIGHYTSWQVHPTCGLLTQTAILGYYDNPRCFADPNRVKASCLWVGHGYLEYTVPNYLNSMQLPTEIQLQMEICSEAPGYEEIWPSDIYFSINGITLGYWTSPGDFGAVKGLLTPQWCNDGSTSQYGMLKTITVNKEGSYIDGIKISDITINQVVSQEDETIRFKIDSPLDAKNPRGFNLFGRGFGNYDQDINVTIITDNSGGDVE